MSKLYDPSSPQATQGLTWGTNLGIKKLGLITYAPWFVSEM